MARRSPPRSDTTVAPFSPRELKRLRASVEDRLEQYWKFSDGAITRGEINNLVAACIFRVSFDARTANADEITAFQLAWPRIEHSLRRFRDAKQQSDKLPCNGEPAAA